MPPSARPARASNGEPKLIAPTEDPAIRTNSLRLQPERIFISPSSQQLISCLTDEWTSRDERRCSDRIAASLASTPEPAHPRRSTVPARTDTPTYPHPDS